jgi:hypothetical protein
VLVFPSAYQKSGRYCQESSVVMLRGKFDLKEENMPKIIADDLFPMDEVYRIINSVEINLSGLRDNVFESLKGLLAASPGQVPVYLHFDSAYAREYAGNKPVGPGYSTHVQLLVGSELFVQPSEKLFEDVDTLLGDGRISLKI